MMNYYRWPNGVFEFLGGIHGWRVLKYRPMPNTPAGDSVATFKTKEEADIAAAELNENNIKLSDAIAKYFPMREE